MDTDTDTEMDVDMDMLVVGSHHSCDTEPGFCPRSHDLGPGFARELVGS